MVYHNLNNILYSTLKTLILHKILEKNKLILCKIESIIRVHQMWCEQRSPDRKHELTEVAVGQ